MHSPLGPDSLSVASVASVFQLAVQHHQAGRWAEAEELYRRILAVQPSHADAIQMLGMIALHVGRHSEALQLLDAAIAIHPAAAEYHGNRAVILVQLQRQTEAMSAYRRAIELNPNLAGLHNNLGDLLWAGGNGAEAIEHFRVAIALKPDYAQAMYNLGNVAREMGQDGEALDAYRRALALRQWPELLNNFGNLLCDTGQFEPAIELFRRAVDLQPGLAQSHNNLGNALRGAGQLDQAMAAYQQALALRPDLLDAQNNLACVYSAQGHPEEAAARFEQIISAHPDYAPAHWELAAVLLARGEYRRGWQEYEWRWRVGALRLGAPPRSPRWDGADLNGKTILLHAEQGLGDHIQFARYIPQVAARGGKIILACQAELVPLLAGMAGVQRCVAADQALPEHDVHCPMLSLPYVLGTGENIPANVPYLFADEALEHQWKARLPESGRKKVGLVWRGRHLPDRFRSIPAEALAPLAAVVGVEFVSLQTGLEPGAKEQLPRGMNVIHLGSSFRDFGDTAAVIAQLDLVITIDTAAAHLAGAMGKATWVLLRDVPDWRWKPDGDRCAWYPTARLFRQKRFGDWGGPIGQIAQALAAL